MDVAEVHAELEVVLAVGPVDCVSNLLACFIREARALQERRGAEL